MAEAYEDEAEAYEDEVGRLKKRIRELELAQAAEIERVHQGLLAIASRYYKSNNLVSEMIIRQAIEEIFF